MSMVVRRPGEVAARAVAAFEREFPGRLRSVFLLGSYSDGSSTETSDLDITLIFAGAFVGDGEREAAHQLARACTEASEIEMDIEVEDEAALAHGVSPNLKLASAHIYGEDIRDRMTLMPLDEWTRDRMHSTWWRIARLFARPSTIKPPLRYPEPEQPFLGYTRRTLQLPDGREVPCTRDLIRLTGWAATALLALDQGIFVPSKRQAHTLYASRIGGPWADLITNVYALCRLRWNYLIPAEPMERAQLRALCAETLEFERYMLTRYLPYVIAELRAGGRRAQIACEVMWRAPLATQAIARELCILADSDNDATQAEARKALGECRQSSALVKRAR